MHYIIVEITFVNVLQNKKYKPTNMHIFVTHMKIQVFQVNLGDVVFFKN